MSRRKMFMVLMVVALMVLASSTAFAAATWHECKVLAVGGQLSSVNIQLGNAVTGKPFEGDVNSGWYGIGGARSKEMLATALTAISLNKTVWAIFEVGVMTSLQAIYLKGN
jgi:hypothetical protein